MKRMLNDEQESGLVVNLARGTGQTGNEVRQVSCGLQKFLKKVNLPQLDHVEPQLWPDWSVRCNSADDEEGDEGENGDGNGTDVIVKPRAKTQKPRLYKVLLLNDDYTPMDFVIYILERFFNKSRSEATDVMLQVHRSGVGICGVFTHEVAETKVSQVLSLARQKEHPLQCTMEKE